MPELLLKLIDVFGGPGFLTKAANHGNVLDTKLGPRYDMTKPHVLTRIRQDVSAGDCISALISLPRLHTSCSSQVVSASASIAILLHRARMPRILEHPCDSWFCGTCQKSTPFRRSFERPGPCGFLHLWCSSQNLGTCVIHHVSSPLHHVQSRLFVFVK